MSATCLARRVLRLSFSSPVFRASSYTTYSRPVAGERQRLRQRRGYAVDANNDSSNSNADSGSSSGNGNRNEKEKTEEEVDLVSAPTGRAYGPSSFDRLFSLFTLVSDSSKTQPRPLNPEELALLIAALFSSTNNKLKISKLEKIIPAYIEKYNYDTSKLYKKVNEFVNGFNEKGVDVGSVEKALRTRVGSVTGSEVRAEKGLAKPGVRPTPAELVPREDLEGKSPLDQLFLYIETPYARSILQNLEPEDTREFLFLMRQVMDSSGRENMGVLNTLKKFLGLRGVEIVYLRNKETEKLGHAATDQVKETKSESESESESAWSMDEVELAKRAAADESLNPLDTPTLRANDPYPNLMTADPLLDARDEVVFPPTPSSPYTNRVIVRNHSSIFHAALQAESGTQDPFSDPNTDWEPEATDETSEDLESFENLPLPAKEVKNLYRFPLIVRRVTQQTGKGKIHRVQYLVVVGNGDGLVGYGQAKDEDAPRALAKATALAIRNMDTVARFEKRTVPTEMETKLGSTHIIMRPRPVGFGLRCNPNLHQVLKAAGIKDVSAKVWGSRNPVSVVKAAFRMLWAGHAPVGMGDGVGGKGRKLDKGEGVRSVLEVERERGRRWVGLRM